MDTAAAAAAGQDDDEQEVGLPKCNKKTSTSPLSGQKRPRSPPVPQQTPQSRMMATTMGRGKGRNLPAWMMTTKATCSSNGSTRSGPAAMMSAAESSAQFIVEPPVVPCPPPPQPRLWNVEWMDMPASSSSCSSASGGASGRRGGGGNNKRGGSTTISRKRGRIAATSNQNNNSQRVAVIHFNGPNTSILVQGRGSLCCTRGSVDIHGYRLTGGSNKTSPYSIQEMIRENSNSLTFLPFDVPAWSTSWLTITSTSRNPGAQVTIRSAAATTRAAAAAPQQPKASIVKTTGKEQATFSIHDAISRENIDSADDDDDDDARPTVIPDEWKQSASDILDDYHHQHHQEQPQQQQHDSSCTAASLPFRLPESPPVQNPPPRRRFVVAITGGKSVGKSSYLRYLLHRFMSLQPRGHDDNASADGDESLAEAQETLPPLNNKDRFIAILDGDPGQPELGPVGTLTLTILQISSASGGCDTNATRTTTTTATTRPLWSPPHCNMVLPPSDQQRQQQQEHQQGAWTMPPPATRYERAYFYGSTTVQTDPQLYLECMSRLMTAYDQWQQTQAQQQQYFTTPLLINLHGWVKGLGFTLLQALLQQHLAPCRHVVQIMGTLSSQVFDLRSVLYNSNKDYYSDGDDTNENDHDDDKDNTPLLHVIPSFLDNHHPHHHHSPFAHGCMLPPTTTSINNNEIINNNNTQEQQASLSRHEQFISSSRAATTAGTSSSSHVSAKSFSTDEENNHDQNECFKLKEEEKIQENPKMSTSTTALSLAGTATAATTPPVPDSVAQDAIANLPPTESAGETSTPTLTQAAPAVSANSDIRNNHHRNNKLIAVNAPSIPAAALRTLRLCTYFVANTNLSLYTWPQHDITFSQKAGLQDPKCRIAHCLAAEKPYVVPMECLSIRHVFENNIINSPDEQQWWHLLNASVVGLCYDHEDDCVNNDNDNDHDATAPPPPRCVGLGIVRSIDWQRKLLYLLTPIAPDQLARVHVLLVGGNLVLPLQCTFRGAHAEAFPYQSQNSLAKMKQLAGAEPMKSRNTLVRRNTSAGPSWW